MQQLYHNMRRGLWEFRMGQHGCKMVDRKIQFVKPPTRVKMAQAALAMSVPSIVDASGVYWQLVLNSTKQIHEAEQEGYLPFATYTR